MSSHPIFRPLHECFSANLIYTSGHLTESTQLYISPPRNTSLTHAAQSRAPFQLAARTSKLQLRPRSKLPASISLSFGRVRLLSIYIYARAEIRIGRDKMRNFIPRNLLKQFPRGHHGGVWLSREIARGQVEGNRTTTTTTRRMPNGKRKSERESWRQTSASSLRRGRGSFALCICICAYMWNASE